MTLFFRLSRLGEQLGQGLRLVLFFTGKALPDLEFRIQPFQRGLPISQFGEPPQFRLAVWIRRRGPSFSPQSRPIYSVFGPTRVRPDRSVVGHKPLRPDGARCGPRFGSKTTSERLRGLQLDFREKFFIPVNGLAADSKCPTSAEFNVGVAARLQFFAPNGGFNRPAVNRDELIHLRYLARHGRRRPSVKPPPTEFGCTRSRRRGQRNCAQGRGPRAALRSTRNQVRKSMLPANAHATAAATSVRNMNRPRPSRDMPRKTISFGRVAGRESKLDSAIKGTSGRRQGRPLIMNLVRKSHRRVLSPMTKLRLD